MICKSVGMKHTCKEILLGVQLFRLFAKGCTAGTLLPVTSKACEWVKFWNINSREKSCIVGLNSLSVTERLELVQGKKKLLLVFQECFGQAVLSASLPWTVLQQPAKHPLHLHRAHVLSTGISFMSFQRSSNL